MSKPETMYPVGLGGKMNREAKTLPVFEVSNEVERVNPAFEHTSFLDLEVGKQSKLGVFFNDDNNLDHRSVEVDPAPESLKGRAGILGRFVFKDKTRLKDTDVYNFYREILAKGIGFFKTKFFFRHSWEAHKHKIWKPEKDYSIQGTQGICNFNDAKLDYENSEELHMLGVRLARPVAIIKLKEIFADQKKCTIEEAKKAGILQESDEPVVYLRAFGAETRVNTFCNLGRKAQKKYLNDARILIAQELGIDPKKFTTHEYLEWFFRTVGKNLGIMHKNNFLHKNLGAGHNVSLDARFSDFDTLKQNQIAGWLPFRSETTNCSDFLKRFTQSVREISPDAKLLTFQDYIENFWEEYNKQTR